MENANDLRIGNYVLYLDEIYMVDGIKFEKLNPYKWRIGIKSMDFKFQNAKTLNWIEPILLTQEWPDQFGFVKDRNGWYMPGTQFSLTDKFYPCWLDRMLWPQDLPDFKDLSLEYIHQLQNLFLDLTRKELIITSPQPEPKKSL